MTLTATERKDGRVVGIAGPVIDVEFPRGHLPEINTALELDVTMDGEATKIVAETAQQIGDSRVRAICLRATDGLTRTAVMFFLIANDGLSMLENLSECGLPIPDVLKQTLETFRKKGDAPEAGGQGG